MGGSEKNQVYSIINILKAGPSPPMSDLILETRNAAKPLFLDRAN